MMKNKLLIFPVLLVCSFFGCSGGNNEIIGTSGTQAFHLEIVDSIRIDYLGDLEITDIHQETAEILGFNFRTKDLVIFDQTGKIIEQFSRGGDRPNPINSMVSLGFYKGDKLLVANNNGMLAVFEKNGVHIEDIPLPFQIQYFNWTQRKKIYSLSDSLLLGQIAELKNFNGYEEYYLNFIDLKTGELTPALSIPDSSKYSSGDYYFSLYPYITKMGDYLYMLLSNEPALHVYKLEGMNVGYVETIEFGGDEFVEVISSKDHEDFDFEMNFDQMQPGAVEGFFDVGDFLVAYFRKGIDATVYKEEFSDDPLLTMQMNPHYLAVFDEEHKLLNNGVEVPLQVGFIQGVMPDGRLLAKKNKYLLKEEEDFEMYYLMELIEE
ncbi:hypothetical protein DN752_09200 [Echinicola strongylocentroti]|uniref:6-bladed beta-propeller n=2 Tax=Echinicola strongylocentroti TaxID=1795355 RepID=A0A2Z4IH24_9BACT|nr:hypothetical protein DN752_09200 [Echinicola strongylocentroti]